MKFIIVHAAATFPSMDVDVKWIDRVHKERGFAKVGYHYFIKRNGIVQIGRPENEMGAHTLGFNKDTLGICMAGGLKEGTKIPEDNFTDAQYKSLEDLYEKLHNKYPEAEFRGHNDFKGHESRGCPCFDHQTFFAILRIKLGITDLSIPMEPDTILNVENGTYTSWDFKIPQNI